MKATTAALVLAAALGVSARPSAHAHRHQHRQIEELADGEFYIAKKPVIAPPPPPKPTKAAPPPPPPPPPPPVTTTSVAPPPPPPAPTTTTAAPPPPPPVHTPAASASASSGSSGNSGPAGFCGGSSTRKRATAAEIAYTGNIGVEGDYGCNMKIVPSASGYDYTSTFTNAGGDSSCVCWLKIGPDGGINGFFTGNQALTFDLPAGSSKILAVEANTQGGCSCAPGGSVPTTSFGQFASTWYEFDFGNESNGAWSGADASSLVAAQYGMEIPGLNVCSSGTCSTINAGGSGHNAFVGGTAAQDGLGCNISPGSANVEVTIGYSG